MSQPNRRLPGGLRTEAERDALGAGTRYSRTHGLSRPAEAAYLEALADARREIGYRLVRGLLRGRPDGLSTPRFLPAEPTDIPDDPAPLSV